MTKQDKLELDLLLERASYVLIICGVTALVTLIITICTL